MKKYFILFPLFLLFTFINLSGIESSGHLSLLEGDVKIVKTNGDMLRGKTNYPLVTGDVILTGKTGRCEIQLSNGTLLRLDKNSDIKLVSLLTDSVTSNKKISTVKLMSGSIYTMAQIYKQEILQIITPQISVKMENRSTNLIRTCEKESSIHVIRGKVRVLYGNQRKTYIKSGEFVIFPRKGKKHTSKKIYNGMYNVFLPIKARNKELIALIERDNIISTQKLKLEKIVKERNKEIINTNFELSEHQKEIENQTNEIELKNQEISIVNQQLLLQNKKIEDQNISLQGNKYEMEEIVDLRTKELEKEKDRAIVADNLKTSFLNNLSREIKTPMNAITGFATLILNKSLSVVERNKYLQTIIQNVDALLSLIDNIVTLSKIQAGVIKLKTREIDLKAFIKLVADEFTEKL